MNTVLFLLLLLVSSVYSNYDNNNKASKKQKDAKSVISCENEIIPDVKDDCIFLCIITPNCKTFELRNGTCYFTIKWLSDDLPLKNNEKSNRTKRKSEIEGRIDDTAVEGANSLGHSRTSRSIFGYRRSCGFFSYIFGACYQRTSFGSIIFWFLILFLLGAILVCALYYAVIKAIQACRM